MIIVKTSVWQYARILLHILGSSWIFKMLLKSFENNGKNISENIAKLKLEQNIKSQLYDHLVYICAEETDFWQFYDKPQTRLRTHFDTVHSWRS